MKIVLHIGMNKTGTSSLQFACSRNQKVLAEAGILYPEFGQEYSAHHGIAFGIHRHTTKKKRQNDRWAQLGDDWINKLEHEASDYDVVLLSSEAFHHLGDPSEVARAFSGHDVKIVVYLREHFSYIRSWYQQNVQDGVETCLFRDFAGIRKAAQCTVLDAWVESFGINNVVPKIFDKSQLISGDIVEDFFSSAALPRVNTKLFADAVGGKNPSVSGNLLFFRRQTNQLLTREQATSVSDEVGAMTVLDASFRGPIGVEEDLASQVRDRYKQDRRLLHDKYGLCFDGLPWDPHGFRCPDMDRIHSDWKLFINEMRRTEKKMLHLLTDRSPDLDVLLQSIQSSV